jgi:hypothetical protein
MAVTGFPEERVVLLARADVPYHAQADQYVRIWPRSQTTQGPIVQGAGRLDARVVRRVSVCLWTRLALDEADRDNSWLLHATLGHLDAEHKLFDALLGFHPEDADGNWLCYEDCRVVAAAEPSKDRAEPEWGKSEVDVEVPYVLDLNQSYF